MMETVDKAIRFTTTDCKMETATNECQNAIKSYMTINI